jgi:RNA polymerase sigma-70 factor (ECF subfamily)
MDESASREFAEFYEGWFGRVYNYARHRTGSATAADEIAADTFSRAFRSWSAFDPGKGDRRTWLFSIAFRAVADHYRSAKRDVSLDELPEPPESGGGPSQAVEEALTHEQLAAALGRLPGPQREVVSLKFYGGMTNRAIGGLLGISESNVAVTLFRAIRKMRHSFTSVEA